MNRRIVLLVWLLAFLTATCAHTRSEDHWDEYQRRTLKSIIESQGDLKGLDKIKGVDRKKNAMYFPGTFPSQAELVYLDGFRPMSPKHVSLLAAWRTSVGGYAPPADAFTTEAQFREGSEEYWISVQQPLLDGFRKDVRRGDVIEAYVVLIGAIRVGRRWEWLFAMNRFDS